MSLSFSVLYHALNTKPKPHKNTPKDLFHKAASRRLTQLQLEFPQHRMQRDFCNLCVATRTLLQRLNVAITIALIFSLLSLQTDQYI